MEIFAIKELSFTFPERDKEALSHINLSIKSGEFVAVCGRSGSGKSTLLRHLKPALTPHGNRSGCIYYSGEPIESLDARKQAAEIGFVLQNPDNGIVTDKVWHELAFGLESLGMDTRTIRLRVAEMASFFGIQGWFHNNVSELSGGQKQLLCLASIMVMHPQVLILDEPTSQLDPIAASDFLETVKRINRELGTTIIMTEHRLEDIIPAADRVIAMDQGTIIANDTPRKVGGLLGQMGHPLFQSMPTPMQIYAEVDNEQLSPLTVKEGRQWVNSLLHNKSDTADFLEAGNEPSDNSKKTIISLQDVWFRYEKNGPDRIKDLSLEVKEGQFHCIVGGNGTGKTTALSLISGMLKPYRGKVLLGGSNPAAMKAKERFTNYLGVLPQNPQSIFVKKTVELDLLEMLSGTPLSNEVKAQKVAEVVRLTELEHVQFAHPYDLSGGEQQRAALAKILLLEPRILLLDEPTKGLDNFFKEKLAVVLKKLITQGVTIVMVSHDIEFCAKHGEVCSMFFDGGIITTNTARTFFGGNSFYTTAANRMVRHMWSEAVTIEEVVDRCRPYKV
ncbi:ABC transporter ATP-binding protein [Paenibacillus sp. L3-i20]|uniref:ABC transporter ATP-binding protein n=1 Tax=Paenibacillus sp. L3-i20 TaxID=2905833 RepID=UPI001EDD5FE3|nr:ATP-binding cassette domain-containing protein [Paenibacillus sp. L3-i20]GKU76204.1 hypothetical protein L3i20_v206010 [Paenibacillus sp. L3-i20]